MSWRLGIVGASFVARTKLLYCALSRVSTEIGDRLWAGRYVTKPTGSTQPYGVDKYRVPASIGWGKGGNVAS